MTSLQITEEWKTNGSWSNFKTCWFKIDKKKENLPFILFDYDDTLSIKYTTDILPNVKEILLELDKKYNICIFTNQMGISKGKTSHEKVQNILSNFQSKIDIPLQIFYSTEDDQFRKPMKGMYDLMKSILKPEKINFYCGDAAGRLNDHSISDLYFANNCNLVFKLPEEIFNNSKNIIIASKKLKSLDLYNDDKWNKGIIENPRNIINIEKINNLNLEKLELEVEGKKTLIILVGPQACGKTTFANYISNKYNYGLINGDIHKTKTTMKKYFKKYQQEKIGIIIDNTNPTKKGRTEWIDLLTDKNKWNIIIIHIDICKLESIHLTKYRKYYGGSKIPSVAIHKYYKNLEIPQNEEGTVLKFSKALYNSEFDFNQNLRFN